MIRTAIVRLQVTRYNACIAVSVILFGNMLWKLYILNLYLLNVYESEISVYLGNLIECENVSSFICFFINLFLHLSLFSSFLRFFVTSATPLPLFSFVARQHTWIRHKTPTYNLGTLLSDFNGGRLLASNLSLKIIQFHNIILLILLNYSDFNRQLDLQSGYSIFPHPVSSSVFLFLLLSILLSMWDSFFNFEEAFC